MRCCFSPPSFFVYRRFRPLRAFIRGRASRAWRARRLTTAPPIEAGCLRKAAVGVRVGKHGAMQRRTLSPSSRAATTIPKPWLPNSAFSRKRSSENGPETESLGANYRPLKRIWAMYFGPYPDFRTAITEGTLIPDDLAFRVSNHTSNSHFKTENG